MLLSYSPFNMSFTDSFVFLDNDVDAIDFLVYSSAIAITLLEFKEISRVSFKIFTLDRFAKDCC